LRRLFVLILLSAGIFTGCVRVEQELVLQSNGSGVLRIVYSADEENASRMRALANGVAAVDPDIESSDVDWLTSFDEKKIRAEWAKHETPGVTLTSVKTSAAGGWRTMRAEIQFKTLQHLLDCGMIRDSHIALTRGPDGQYGYQQSISTRRIMKALPAGMDMDHLDFVAGPMLEDFRAKFQVVAPGRIIRSNADRVEGQRAIWEISGSDPSVLQKIRDVDMRLMFEGRNLKIADARMGG